MWHAGGRVCLIPPSMFCDGSWLEVDLGRLRGNAAAIQAALGPAGLIAVVKSDAYGHGLGPAAAALARAGVKRFAVAYAAEAAAVRTAVPAAELILVLGAACPAGAVCRAGEPVRGVPEDRPGRWGRLPWRLRSKGRCGRESSARSLGPAAS